MKTFLAIAVAMFTASVSNAEVKVFGKFVPSVCSMKVIGGPEIGLVAVDSVCVGKLARMNKRAIQLELNDGTTRTYSFELESDISGMGLHSSKFKGVSLDSNVSDSISGVYTVSSGITVTYNISLKTASNLRYKAALQHVAVTQ